MTIAEFLLAVRSFSWEAIATLLALVAIWQAHRANRFARTVVELEGTFDRADVELGLFGQAGITRFILLVPLEPPPLLFPIPISIRNRGSATATEAQLIVHGNEDLLPYSREWLEKEQPDSSGTVVAGFLGRTGHTNSVMFRISHLHPGAPINLITFAKLSTPTTFRSRAPIQTPDGAKGTIGYRVVFDYQLDAVLFHRNHPPRGESFRLGVLDAGDRPVNEVLGQYWRERREGHGKREARRRYWWRRSEGRKLERICVVTVDGAKLQERNGPSAEGMREVPLDALTGAVGVMDDDGIFVPALGVQVGSFAGTIKGHASCRST